MHCCNIYVLLLNANRLSHKAELLKRQTEIGEVQNLSKKGKIIENDLENEIVKLHISSSVGHSTLPMGNPMKTDWQPILGITW